MALLPALHHLRIDGKGGKDGARALGGGCCTGVHLTIDGNGEIRQPRASEPPWASTEGEKDDECPVCYDEFSQVMPRPTQTLPAPMEVVVVCNNGHPMHKGCYVRTRWSGHAQCPICRAPLLPITDILTVDVAEYDDSDPTVLDAQRALRKIVDQFGTTTEYAGPAGAEHKTKQTLPDGLTTIIFEGDKGSEHKVRMKRVRRPTDTEPYEEFFYVGDKNFERKWKKEEYSLGPGVYHVTTWYEGDRPNEHMTERHFYDVSGGAKRLVRKEYATGNKVFYEGEAGFERKVRVETALGYKLYFTGEHPNEQLTHTVGPDGNVPWFPDGTVSVADDEWDDARTRRREALSVINRSVRRRTER